MSLKKFRLFFEKDIYTKTKQTVAKMIFYVFTISTITKSEICFDTRVGSEGGQSQLSFLQLYDEVLHVCFMLACCRVFFVSVNVTFFYSTLFSEPSVPSQRENQCANFHKLTAAAFNSVYFSVQTLLRLKRNNT